MAKRKGTRFQDEPPSVVAVEDLPPEKPLPVAAATIDLEEARSVDHAIRTLAALAVRASRPGTR